MKLSILDQAPVTKGHSPTTALQNSVELAQLGDRLGYERMWLAEHHNTNVFASSAPEISAAYISAKTERIRIGTGGVMMMHYSPLKLAEVFKTLSAYAPNRIDFGVGRAPGGDGQSMYALAEGRQPMLHNMYEKLDTALSYLQDIPPTDDLYRPVRATPTAVDLPQTWLLGSSGNSALKAAQKGMGYSYAQFFTGEMDKMTLAHYTKNFVPSPFMERPQIVVSYMATVADTEEQAIYEALPQDIWRLNFMKGRIEQLLTPEQAANYPLSELDHMEILNNRKQHLVGSAQQVSDLLQQQQAYYGFDEAMIISIPHSQKQRLKTYQLLAQQLL